jgi:hypothetical protein
MGDICWQKSSDNCCQYQRENTGQPAPRMLKMMLKNGHQKNTQHKG